MIIAGAVPGNEAINARLVETGGAGVVARPEDVGPTVQQLRGAHVIARMGSRARRLVFAHAADRVIDVALRAEQDVRAGRALRGGLRSRRDARHAGERLAWLA